MSAHSRLVVQILKLEIIKHSYNVAMANTYLPTTLSIPLPLDISISDSGASIMVAISEQLHGACACAKDGKKHIHASI